MIPFNDFHDGLLVSMSFDIQKREAAVRILAYEAAESKLRAGYLLVLEDVVSLSVVADLEELENNALSGQIVSLYLPETDGTTRVNLTGGTIIIVSRAFHVDLFNDDRQGS